jgi:hypothetical protein
MNKTFGPNNRSATQTYTYPSGFGPPPAAPSQVVEFVSGYAKGSDTPNFNRRRSDGELLPMNFYTRSDVSNKMNLRANCQFDYISVHGQITTQNIPNSVSVPVPSVESWFSSKSSALESLTLSALANAVPPVDALTSALEFAKTLRLITGVVSRTHHYLDQMLRAGMIARGVALADLWLELRYGWRLLYYDISAINKTLGNPVNMFVEGQTGESLSESFSGTTNYLPMLHWADRVRIWGSYDHTDDVSLRARVVAKYHAVADGRFLANPTLTAYELVYYSFVLDWIINIGDYLKQCHVLANAKVVACNSVKVASKSSCNTWTCTVTDSAYSSPSAVGGWSRDATSIMRVPVTVPSAALTTRLSLSSQQSLDLIALIVSFLASDSAREAHRLRSPWR